MKLFIQTLGCAMNERDSAHMIAELRDKKHYTLTNDIKQADLILINTCSVREKPEKKLFSEIGAFAKEKKAGAKIGVCGCTASHLGEEIIKKAPSVDFVLGARNVSKITQVLERPKAVEVDIDYDDSTYVFASSQGMGIKAHLNISIGCDKKCSYCIVPFTRGKEISVPKDLLISEAKKCVASGAKELLLLGQNVNNYGVRFSHSHPKTNFTQLLRALSEIDGLYRIRFTSPHPLHMDDEFLEEFASNPVIAKGIHIPLQSGSSQILKMMRRGYDKQWYLNRIAKLKSLVPNVGIGTDIIVGFPTESEQDFEDTMEVLSLVEFDTLYSFVYSPRPHTSAFEYDKSMLVSPEVAKERLARLQNLHKEILSKKAQLEIGRIHNVLIENHYNGEGQCWSEGRSSSNKLIKILDKKCEIGSIVKVEITHNEGGGLMGRFINELSLSEALASKEYFQNPIYIQEGALC
ncbi:tRNA (N6-isopentenyl adenosine(37)-C2)-methylthiotransferase MiaB [Helicobacter hepaticus]|jgi:tRNA-2-methylthio-N6-dimethylallyladenosine synthase|uniref:tRNA-2-methylthio-N(6)-dimethylallyladenosine synthase n=1 Tax=Helicobacter hepaticus (strain ATCC 51449 / 3B1) TaxID=235279 RepID=MIAB_HELHP|nr:tRNA (N6-isopentenyl adenosine(37)-C2)-methylthiotransferase MiaB [Helicobacter hepaticus]Q7VGP6.2 RecName: Full=tRNA-2-methylthio-N(6)-dimethylallyladenosine synthase; AltName: Full=(Dimethylallyl)adenosine tRNA methylthiotransferase MiaB; AltName: Full=tRNA-i(6)A37 methylthiotransferase [Helicobacter hepaticus ATCC 51449]